MCVCECACGCVCACMHTHICTHIYALAIEMKLRLDTIHLMRKVYLNGLPENPKVLTQGNGKMWNHTKLVVCTGIWCPISREQVAWHRSPQLCGLFTWRVSSNFILHKQTNNLWLRLKVFKIQFNDKLNFLFMRYAKPAGILCLIKEISSE